MTELEEFTAEQQEDGRWFVLENGKFLCACQTEGVAKNIVFYLRRDAEDYEQPSNPL